MLCIMFVLLCRQAIEQGDCSVVSKWLQCIPPDQVKETVDTVYARGKSDEKRNTLLLAVQHGQAEIVKLVLDAGASKFCAFGDLLIVSPVSLSDASAGLTIQIIDIGY